MDTAPGGGGKQAPPCINQQLGSSGVPRVDEYAQLKRLITQQGLLDRQPRHYMPHAAGLSAMLVATAAGVGLTRNSWWVLAWAAPAAFLFGQLGFMAHEAAHNQILRTSRGNYALSLLLFNLGLGGSRGWWANKHTIHHAQPSWRGTAVAGADSSKNGGRTNRILDALPANERERLVASMDLTTLAIKTVLFEPGAAHEFLGQMLGSRRATVTLSAGLLQAAGLIRYHRGHVTIVDREGLEGVACECYKVIRDELDRVVDRASARGREAQPTPTRRTRRARA